MPVLNRLTVLKFGSSILEGAAGYRAAASEIRREANRRRRVLAVVSARRGVTDHLLAEARAMSRKRSGELEARLVGTGEEASAALLGMAARTVGLGVAVLGGAELSLRTEGPVDDAVPVAVDLTGLRAAIAAHGVTIVPGFVGRDARGRPTLLGRGGSDYTALFLAASLGADEVRLVKDVDGVFPCDPRHRPTPGPGPLHAATWEEVERVGHGVVQPKALRFAAARGLAFQVSGLGGRGTWVGDGRPPAEEAS